MGLSRTVSEINGDFSRKVQIFLSPVYFTPRWIPLELDIGARGVENYDDGTTGPREKFNDIFRSLDTMHEHDRQRRTDGQTPSNSKDRAYA